MGAQERLVSRRSLGATVRRECGRDRHDARHLIATGRADEARLQLSRVIEEDNEFTSERHVYEPHKIGIPPLRPYVRELWRRREFAREMSRTNLRAQHFNTAFGQLWLVLNPLMLAGVYFLLVYILRGSGSRGVDFFAHLLAGLFAYYFISETFEEVAAADLEGAPSYFAFAAVGLVIGLVVLWPRDGRDGIDTGAPPGLLRLAPGADGEADQIKPGAAIWN